MTNSYLQVHFKVKHFVQICPDIFPGSHIANICGTGDFKYIFTINIAGAGEYF